MTLKILQTHIILEISGGGAYGCVTMQNTVKWKCHAFGTAWSNDQYFKTYDNGKSYQDLLVPKEPTSGESWRWLSSAVVECVNQTTSSRQPSFGGFYIASDHIRCRQFWCYWQTNSQDNLKIATKEGQSFYPIVTVPISCLSGSSTLSIK